MTMTVPVYLSKVGSWLRPGDVCLGKLHYSSLASPVSRLRLARLLCTVANCRGLGKKPQSRRQDSLSSVGPPHSAAELTRNARRHDEQQPTHHQHLEHLLAGHDVSRRVLRSGSTDRGLASRCARKSNIQGPPPYDGNDDDIGDLAKPRSGKQR